MRGVRAALQGAALLGAGLTLSAPDTDAPPAPSPLTASAEPSAHASPPQQEAPAYNGRFRFNRIQYSTGGRFMRGFRQRQPMWAHDAPYAEFNFAKILDATTLASPNLEGRYTTLDDPALFDYPVAFIVEVGFWSPSDDDLVAMHDFLLKGGFLIVDDFRGPRELGNFEFHMRKAIPGAQLMRVPDDHPVFDSFFRIDEPEALTPPYGGYPPMYLGIFEDNDPEGRLMVMLNYNNDHMEYWEFSDRGYYPIDLTNDAYKFGVNYVIYAMTH